MKNKRFVILCVCLILCTKLNAQIITTFAGNGCIGSDSGDGVPATAACIGYPVAGSFDDAGNYYFAQDLYGSRVMKVNTKGIISIVAGNGISGYSGDGGQATAASFDWPYAIVDSAGNIFLANAYDYRVRKVDAVTGIISTIAGNGHGGHLGDDGPASSASLYPSSICIDRHGNIYVTDSSTWIRRISTVGVITTVAGNGIQGYSGDGGQATDAALYTTYGLCTDAIGNILIGDGNGRIRKIDVSTGIINTIAGDGTRAPFLGDGLPATASQIYPYTITTDKVGNIFISDYGVGNSRVLKIDTLGIVHTIAGTGIDGYSGDGGIATDAQLANPEGVAIDACGNVYIADDAYRRIRKVTYDTSCNPYEALYSKEITETGAVSVYPNPAYNELTITANSKISNVTISNLIGQVVYASPGLSTGGEENEKAEVNISGLPQGVYIVRVTDSEGRVMITKIVKE